MQQIFEQLVSRTHAVSNWVSRGARLGNGVGGILILALLLNPVRAFSATPSGTQSVTLLWDSNPNAEVIAGYRIYFGTASGSYSDSVAVGNVTTGTVTGLARGVTYYFAVTANDVSGLESGYSDEVIYLPRVSRMQTRLAPDGQMVLSVQGPVGHMYFLEASEDLMNWTVIGLVFFESAVAMEFTDPDAASYSKRFYRLRDASQ